jgi:hypothetical protein
MFFQGALRSFDIEGQISDVAAVMLCLVIEELESRLLQARRQVVLTSLGIGT